MNGKILTLLILILMVALAGCRPGSSGHATETPLVTKSEAATATHTPPSTATSIPPTATTTSTPTHTATFTLAPTATEKNCLALISPPNEEWVRAFGNLAFEWEPWPGALNYRLQISVPNGWVMSIDLQKTSQIRYMQTLPAEGTYAWKVTALDTRGEPICCSEPFTFMKQGSPTSSGGGGEPSGDTIIVGG